MNITNITEKLRDHQISPSEGEKLLQNLFVTNYKSLIDACNTIVKGYEDDGMENMSNRDDVFYITCKNAINNYIQMLNDETTHSYEIDEIDAHKKIKSRADLIDYLHHELLSHYVED